MAIRTSSGAGVVKSRVCLYFAFESNHKEPFFRTELIIMQILTGYFDT